MKIIKGTSPDWAPEIQAVCRECPPLDTYPLHIYAMCLRDFGNTCCLAVCGTRLAGFITGYKTGIHPTLFFLWQIGVRKEWRKNGVAKNLLEKQMELASEIGAKQIFVTVDPDNSPSLNFFKKAGFFKKNDLFGDIVVETAHCTASHNHYRTGTNQVILLRNI